MAQIVQNIRFWQKLLQHLKVQQGNEEQLLLGSQIQPVLDIQKPYIDTYLQLSTTGAASDSTGSRAQQRFLIMGMGIWGSPDAAGASTLTCTTDNNTGLVFGTIVVGAAGSAYTFQWFPIPILTKTQTSIVLTTTGLTSAVMVAQIYGTYI